MITIREHVPLATSTTFEIGGNARYYCEADSISSLHEAIAWAKSKGVQCTFIAGGSNVLVSDQGINHLVVRITTSECVFAGTRVEVSAGKNLLVLIQEASARGLGGWEKLAGIPGTFGGAVRGNAGAFGTEIKDFIREVRALNIATGELKVFDQSACDFDYRDSYFKRHPDWIVLSGVCELSPVDPRESETRAATTIAEREKRHLQNVRAAGSYFMNPVAPRDVVELFEKEKGVKSKGGRVPAGWLIEKAGMKGERLGGAIASIMHPNYLVNENAATAQEVRALAERIKEEVKRQFGIDLKEEAQYFC